MKAQCYYSKKDQVLRTVHAKKAQKHLRRQKLKQYSSPGMCTKEHDISKVLTFMWISKRKKKRRKKKLFK